VPEESAPFRRLDTTEVEAALAATHFRELRYVTTTGSTNDDAAAVLGDARSLGTIVVAEFQTAGKGRKPGRTWTSPAGSGLTFTAILPRSVRPGALWAVPFWTALAVAEAIEAASGVRVDLRWPNDLLVQGGKAGGILCLSSIAGERAHAACGVGINVRRPPDPPPAADGAAYLDDVAPHARREPVLAAIVRAMDERLPLLDDPPATTAEYEMRSAIDGMPYRVVLDADGTVLAGTARGIAPGGALRLESGGVERRIDLADARVVP
jgi:BirA family transcriptional regulator, biotin operon repressor / biotin---[acetyl-CoA-carboxylase] ligase